MDRARWTRRSVARAVALVLAMSLAVVAGPTGAGAIVLPDGPPWPPNNPAYLMATPGPSSITLTFHTPIPIADDPVVGYVVDRWKDGANVGAVTLPGDATTTSLVVTGLVDGATYSLKVMSMTAHRTSSGIVRSDLIPGTPGRARSVAAIPTATSATVTWTPPVANGTAAITGYHVSSIWSSTRSLDVGPGATSATFPSLPVGASFQFRIQARNAVGLGPEVLITPDVTVGAPAAPGSPLAVPRVVGLSGGIALTYTKPDDHGSPITGYSATCRTASGATKTVTRNGAAPGEILLSGTLGMASTCSVLAINSRGYGPAAMAAPIIVGSPAPPPTVTLASLATTGATGSLTVGFAAPTPTGSTITTTTVRCASGDGGVPRTVTFPSTKAGPVTVTGATTGRAYRCWVAATNGRGTGPETGSPLVIVGAPGMPASASVSRPAAGRLRIAVTAGPANGSPITRHDARCTSSNGGTTGTASSATLPVTVSGLTTGKTYRCTLTSHNARGDSRAAIVGPVQA